MADEARAPNVVHDREHSALAVWSCLPTAHFSPSLWFNYWVEKYDYCYELNLLIIFIFTRGCLGSQSALADAGELLQ